MDRESRRGIRERGEGFMCTHSVLERGKGRVRGLQRRERGWVRRM